MGRSARPVTRTARQAQPDATCAAHGARRKACAAHDSPVSGSCDLCGAHHECREPCSAQLARPGITDLCSAQLGWLRMTQPVPRMARQAQPVPRTAPASPTQKGPRLRDPSHPPSPRRATCPAPPSAPCGPRTSRQGMPPGRCTRAPPSGRRPPTPVPQRRSR